MSRHRRRELAVVTPREAPVAVPFVQPLAGPSEAPDTRPGENLLAGAFECTAHHVAFRVRANYINHMRMEHGDTHG